MKLVKLLALIITGLSLSACRVDLVDGKIPAKYVSIAQKKAGHYKGTFEGKSADVNLIVNNDGSAEVNFNNANGDIVGPGCKSIIGKINAIWATNKKVGGASFNLETQCKILGKAVSLDFNKDEKLEVSVIKSSFEVTTQKCSGGGQICDSNGNCRTLPETCFPQTNTYYNYLSGKFQKK
jgi:hypothetical protein